MCSPLFHERRHHPRIKVDLPAVVRGVDEHSERFEQRTHVCNLSVSGLYLRPVRGVTPGARLFIYFYFLTASHEPGLAVAALAIVQRVEPEVDGSGGVAVMFLRYRCR